MARRSSTPFALREAHGKWSLVAELNQLEDAGDLLASIGQAAPDLPIERYDPKAAIWREVGRVPLRTKTESLFPHQRKPRKRKPSRLPAVAAVTIVASLVFAALLFAPRINAPGINEPRLQGLGAVRQASSDRGALNSKAPENSGTDLKAELVSRIGPITRGIFCKNEIDVDRLIRSASESKIGVANDKAINAFTEGSYGGARCWEFREGSFAILNVDQKVRTVLGETDDVVDMYRIEVHCPAPTNSPYCRDGRAYGVKLMNFAAEAPQLTIDAGRPVYPVKFVNHATSPLAYIDFSASGANSAQNDAVITEIDRGTGLKIECSAGGYSLLVKNDAFESPGRVVASSGLTIDFENLPLRGDETAPRFSTYGPKGLWRVTGPVIGSLLQDLANSQSVRAWSADYRYDPSGWRALKQRCDALRAGSGVSP